MPIPAALGTITLDWTIQTAGKLGTGVVRVWTKYALRDTTDHVILAPSEFVGTVVNGVGSVLIPDPNDADISPQGAPLHVRIDTDVLQDEYDIVIPVGTLPGSTVHLDTFAPAVNPPALVQYALASALLNYLLTSGGTITGPISWTGTPSASGHLTTKGYVDSLVVGGAPDATTSSKGIVQLAGDLGGTAAAPTVPGLASKYVKPGSGIPSSDLAAAVQALLTLAGTAVQPGALAAVATTGAKADVGLANVDNTSDALKPISTATQNALNLKANTADVIAKALVAAKGDLIVATADDTVTVLPVGTNGQVPTADSTQATGIRWATPSGGGGGASFEIVEARITSGNVTWPNTSGAWAKPGDANGLPTDFTLTLTDVQVGDWVEIGVRGMRSDTTSSFVELAVQVGSSIVRYLTTGTSSPAFEGDTSWYPNNTFRTQSAPAGFYATSGDIDSGQVHFVLANKSAGSGTLYASTQYPFWWVAKRWRQ